MLNFGASKPRVKGGGRAPGAHPGSAPVHVVNTNFFPFVQIYFKKSPNSYKINHL